MCVCVCVRVYVCMCIGTESTRWESEKREEHKNDDLGLLDGMYKYCTVYV